MSFAVKDVLDVEGITTGSGNPDWQRTHLPARSTAPAVARWLASGGRMVGKTICDELAFSLEGANFHYGTPRNPRCPGRLPGGSSSGSAAAVAGGLVDGGLGSDTGGSVRVPASFCGIFGFRPTHGRVPVRGMTPLAPTYDTVGWFARDGRTLQRFGRALSMGRRARPPRQLLLVADAWELVEPRSAAPLRDAADALGIRGEVRIYDGDPTAWYEAYRVLQGAQIWSQHHEWIERVHPRFGPRTAERFAASSRITRAEVAEQARFRRRVARRLKDHVRDGRALVLPASPCIALSRRRSLAARAAFYPRALALNSAAGHSGLPEVVLPLAVAEGCPIGLGVIAAAYRDESLLALAASDRTARLARSCRSSSPGPDR
jgi:amidase